MRTTLDIPEDLLRRAKAQAALRGMRLKDFVSEAIRVALATNAGSSESTRSPKATRLELGEGCVFPLIQGEAGPAMRGLTPERLHEILEAEDIERALHPRGC